MEYNDSKYNRLKQSGVASEFTKIGSWEEYDLRGHKEVINYVDGYPDGEYKSYYFSMKDSTYALKQIGNYQYRKKDRSSIRVGTWKYYSEEGQLLQEIDHKWLGPE